MKQRIDRNCRILRSGDHLLERLSATFVLAIRNDYEDCAALSIGILRIAQGIVESSVKLCVLPCNIQFLDSPTKIVPRLFERRFNLVIISERGQCELILRSDFVRK